MNKRQHIALTEAQIIAAEKGELKLEARDGRKVVQFVRCKEPFDQNVNSVIFVVFDDGERTYFHKNGIWRMNNVSEYDLFVSEAVIKPIKPEPEQLYEVGEIIELFYDYNWIDAEFRDSKDGHICVWTGDVYLCCDQFGHHRKKQNYRIYISGRITGLDYKEAFDKFEQAEKELTAKGYEVVNPMKLVPFNKDWSWFDYLSADIKLMENCAHIYMLSNWRESGGASVEHEAAKWNNFAIIYQ